MASKIKRFLIFPLAALVILGLTFVPGCGGGEGTLPGDEVELSGTIKEAGSTSVLPLAEEFAIKFMNLHPKVRVETGGGGSGAGVKQCAAGTVNIGAASRELKITESDLISYPIARDAVAIIVNSANPISQLKIEEAAKIFAGELANWKELNGEDKEITIYAREEGSGTRDCFEEKVMKDRDISDDAILKNSNGEIQGAVATDVAGIGFVSLGYVSGVKALSLWVEKEGNYVECTLENCQKGSYPIIRRLYFLTRESPSDLEKAFIDFCRSPERQQFISEKGYVPLVL